MVWSGKFQPRAGSRPHLERIRDRHEMSGDGPIGPARRVHGIRDKCRIDLMFCRGLKRAGLAQEALGTGPV